MADRVDSSIINSQQISNVRLTLNCLYIIHIMQAPHPQCLLPGYNELSAFIFVLNSELPTLMPGLVLYIKSEQPG